MGPVLELPAAGASISSLARKFHTSRQTTMRVRDADAARVRNEPVMTDTLRNSPRKEDHDDCKS